jgi:hypothetical protein
MTSSYLIVTLGPTGSGKTDLTNKTVSYLGLNPDNVKILIDDLVENNPTYKAKVSSILGDVLKECKTDKTYCKDPECAECDTSSYYEHPSKELLSKFATAYFSTRKGPDCVAGSTLTCEGVNRSIVQNAINNNKNIVFETTGREIPFWLLSAPYMTSNYQIVFAYSIVKFDELIKRNTGRTVKSINAFLANQSNPAPRLPDVEYNSFKEVVLTIRNSLLTLYNKCIITYESESACGTEHIGRLLIFDNSGSAMTLAFDSKNDKLSDSEFASKIDLLFGLNNASGGRRGSRRKKCQSRKRMQSKKRRSYRR